MGTALSAVRATARLSFDTGLSERVVISLSFRCPPPEGAFQGWCRGRSPDFAGRCIPSAFPGLSLQWPAERCSPLTVAGAATELGVSLTVFPSCVPPHAGTDSAPTIAAKRRAARGNPGAHPVKVVGDTLTNVARGLLCAWTTVAHFERTGNAVRRTLQIRGCPRNCKRRAQINLETGLGRPSHRHWDKPGKAARERPAKPGDLPSI